MAKPELVKALYDVLNAHEKRFSVAQFNEKKEIECFIALLEQTFGGVPEVRFLYDRVVCPDGKPPVYATTGAAGADVCSAESYVLQPSEQKLFSTGLYLEIPPDFECQVRPRSGLAAKSKVTITNAPGTLDSDYRGELKVMLINHGAEAICILQGDRIAQLVITRVQQATFVEVKSLSSTTRGANGFGSTGVR